MSRQDGEGSTKAYLIMGVQSLCRHLLLATPASALDAVDSYLAARKRFAEVLINDPQGRPIDFDTLNSHAALEIDAHLSGDESPRTLH